MKNSFYRMTGRAGGFSLAEMIAALMIVALILAAVLTVYSRAEKTIGDITRKLDTPNLANEVLQLISEDIDEIYTAGGSDVTISVENRMSPSGYSLTSLKINREIDVENRDKKTFEQIVWQSSYDYETNRLILYRSHTGLVSEDKMLDDDRAPLEVNYPFVPICEGVTFFKIDIPNFTNRKAEDDPFAEENMQQRWTSNTLPCGLVVTISFSDQVFKNLSGKFDVPYEEKSMRIMAVNTIKNIPFKLAEKTEIDETVINRY